MKAIILAAGRGTRMRPHTHSKPKPLLPIAGKPAIDHILDQLAPLDITEYIFITGYLKEQFENHIKKSGLKARFIEQKTLDGTAGAVKLAEPYIDEPVIIVFSDTLFDADMTIIEKTDADGIFWAQEVEDYQRFGVIVHDDDMIMTNIVEKPSEPISKLANIGLYYIRDYKSLFAGITHIFNKGKTVKGEFFLPEAFMHMVRNGSRIKIAQCDGWYDAGKPETTLETNARMLAKNSRMASTPKDCDINEPVYIGENCVIEGSVIGPDVTIMDGCTIRDAIVQNSIIDEKSRVENITLANSILGEETTLKGSQKEHKAEVLLGDHNIVRL